MADMGLQVDPIAAQDPSYLAFMRGAGYSEAEVMAELARKQGSLQRTLERSAPRFQDELRQAGTAVQNDFTNRGLYRSGARMVGQVDAENNIRRQEQEFRFGIADQKGDMTSAAMRDIAAGRQQAADAALTARQTAAINAANSQPVGSVTGHAVNPPANPPAAPNPNIRPPGTGAAYGAFRGSVMNARRGTRGPQAY